MAFAIAGVTGRTGRTAAEALLARGEKVRVLVRNAAKGEPWRARGAEVAVADLSDIAALTKALEGVDGAYLLIPPNPTAPDYRAYQTEVVVSLSKAVAQSGVRHVVLLSSLGAQVPSGTGPIAALHSAEKLLSEIPSTRLSSLRAAYFYENLAGALAAAKKDGVLPSFFAASLPVPMAATEEIGTLAAELLVDPPQAHRIVQLGTTRTLDEIASAVGDLLGKKITVAEAPLAAVVPTFTSFGFTHDMSSLYAEMIDAIQRGIVTFEAGHRRVESRTPLAKVLGALLTNQT